MTMKNAASGMLYSVALIRTDISVECSASIIRVFLHSVRRLLVTANVVPSSSILVTLMMEVLCSSETSVLITATWHNIPEDGILPLILFPFPCISESDRCWNCEVTTLSRNSVYTHPCAISTGTEP
jgi:hypothetical protein